MAILDAGTYQGWIKAFDNYDQAQRRLDAAGSTGNRESIGYLRGNLEKASREYNAAIKALNEGA